MPNDIFALYKRELKLLIAKERTGAFLSKVEDAMKEGVHCHNRFIILQGRYIRWVGWLNGGIVEREAFSKEMNAINGEALSLVDEFQERDFHLEPVREFVHETNYSDGKLPSQRPKTPRTR